jgi:hypothetical protein
MIKMRNAYRVSVGKPEGKTTLGRPSCKCENSAKIILKTNDLKMCADSSASGWRPAVASYKPDIEPLAFIKGQEFLNKMSVSCFSQHNPLEGVNCFIFYHQHYVTQNFPNDIFVLYLVITSVDVFRCPVWVSEFY